MGTELFNTSRYRVDAGDVLKASGIWVSSPEVKAWLLAHLAVREAIVVQAVDTDGLEKPIGYVQFEAGQQVGEAELIGFCHEGLPSVKHPSKITFAEGSPTVCTGKIRRVDLRSMADTVLLEPEGAPK